jgi:hypothetical protein
MSRHISNEFEPFRVVVSFASEANSADLFIETFTGIGLAFDLSLTSTEDYSHGNRIRALRPRVIAAYDALSSEGRMAAANAALHRFTSLRRQDDQLLAALQKIGWGFQDDRLVAVDPEVREMFFPKGSQWDGFVAIRHIIDRAQAELILVDPYCDRAFFGILDASGVRPMIVRLLCRNNPGGLKAEAQAFAAQHPQVRIELRTSADFHDRFLIVDQSTCVHIGASINHAGSRAFMISTVEDEHNRDALIKAVNQAWSAGVPV